MTLGLGTLMAAEQTEPDAVLPIRGFAIGAPSPERVDDFVDFIEGELVPNNVNTLVLRVDFNYRYRSHPELRDEDALSKAELRKIVKACRKGGIRVIPRRDAGDLRVAECRWPLLQELLSPPPRGARGGVRVG
jgi:hypothetical protein